MNHSSLISILNTRRKFFLLSYIPPSGSICAEHPQRSEICFEIKTLLIYHIIKYKKFFLHQKYVPLRRHSSRTRKTSQTSVFLRSPQKKGSLERPPFFMEKGEPPPSSAASPLGYSVGQSPLKSITSLVMTMPQKTTVQAASAT